MRKLNDFVRRRRNQYLIAVPFILLGSVALAQSPAKAAPTPTAKTKVPETADELNIDDVAGDSPAADKAADTKSEPKTEAKPAPAAKTVAKSAPKPDEKAGSKAEKKADATTTKNDAEFKKKLVLMLEKTDKSIKIIREQIVQNQSAPFLADLYLQLGDFLTEKSTVLYYLQMQGDHRTEAKISATQKFSPVVTTAQEAIAIYDQILKEFPKFDKRDKVLYRLAVSLKSIDESAKFVQTAEILIKEYPNAKETIQVRLLLGQHFFDMQAFEDSLKQLNVVKETSYPYERNAARYRIGLIEIQKEQHAAALKMFEQVAVDDELKEDLNPAELSLKTKVSKTNLKREALIDSVRAYTEVYKDNADPVAYYSRISPTETLFQETIEKLSFRYIFLKRYTLAINLLRVLSERIADPQKVMNIYQEVLVSIPVEQRLDVPVQEMGYVLDKYNDWSNHYALSPQLQKATYEFFEKQMRELGTRSHDLAKVATDPEKKAHLFERARQYYQLYLGFFDKGPRAVKIAVNLADVYYNQRNFFQSGSYYLRVYSGEFGPPTQKVDLLQNAILSLQKPADYAYYEQLRAKGMMVKAVSSYMKLDPKKREDPALNFALSKSIFEQGYYGSAIKQLYGIMKRFPMSREAADSADLILHYYNIRNDFKGLAKWTEKMLVLHTPNKTLQAHLEDVHSKAQLHRLDDAVKTQKGYDVTSQGKSYLQTALSITDSSLRSAALQQALGHSKEERDVETFLRTASAMAKVEKDPKKRAEIYNSMGDEVLAITRFYQAIDIYTHITADAGLDGKTKADAFDKAVKISSMLHDPIRTATLLRMPAARSLPADTSSAAQKQMVSMIESPVVLPDTVQASLIADARDDKKLLTLFKAQARLSPAMRQQMISKVKTQCASDKSSGLCKWVMWPSMTAKIEAFQKKMATSPPKMEAIDPAATEMASLLDATKNYSGTGEPQVDVLVTLGNGQIYQAFAGFLQRAGAANKDFEQILKSKADESFQAAKTSQDQCGKIIQAADMQSSRLSQLCGSRGLASIASTIDEGPKYRLAPPTKDPQDKDVADLEKSIFAKRDDWKSYFTLGETYLSRKNWYHAAATAMMARAAFPQSEEEFNAILGCALVGNGLTGEARFVLAKASDMNGHKTACMDQLKAGGQ
jgi:tetratricopeptide (TPR) repeat protein